MSGGSTVNNDPLVQRKEKLMESHFSLKAPVLGQLQGEQQVDTGWHECWRLPQAHEQLLNLRNVLR